VNHHPPDDELARYVRMPESVGSVRAASVEQHLLTCGGCRSVVADVIPSDAVAASWARVADSIDRPPNRLAASVFERLLPDRFARPVSATIGLQSAWLATTVILAGGAGVLARAVRDDRLYLSVAPLVIVAIVVVTFAPAGEPGGEASFATPAFGLGLILRRLVVALVPAVLALGFVAAVIADLDVGSLAWLLPALGLASTTLALATFVSARSAGVVTAATWVCVVVLSSPVHLVARFDRLRGVDMFDGRAQVVALCVSVASATVLSFRRERIETLEVTW